MPSILELGAPDRDNGHLTATGDSNALLSLLKDQISDFPPGKQYSIAISEVPVTVERLAYYPKEGDRLQDAGTARANIAASNESPNGTSQDNWAENHKHQTVRPASFTFYSLVIVANST
jgi:peroxygenase